MKVRANADPAGKHFTVETEKMKKKRLIIIAFLTSTALLTITGLYIFGHPGRKMNDSSPKPGISVNEGEIDPDTGEEISGNEDNTGNNGKSNMTVRLNGCPVFEDGNSAGNLNIVNPSSNVLYMLIEITLDETGEKIYESGAIPPNHYIDNDRLIISLKQGEYKATARVTLYDPDNSDKQFNGADFNLIITVKN